MATWSKSVRLLLLTLSIVFVVGWIVWGFFPRVKVPNSRVIPQVTQDSFLQLKLGMTEEEIAATLGGPAGNYITKEWGISGGGVPTREDGRKMKYFREWITPTGHATVGFAEDGTACNMDFNAVTVFP